MGFYLPDLMKERKIRTVPVWVNGQRVLVDKYSEQYKNVLNRSKQLRQSFIRENAAQDGHAAMQKSRSGYVIFGDEICCKVANGFPLAGVLRKRGRKWVLDPVF